MLFALLCVSNVALAQADSVKNKKIQYGWAINWDARSSLIEHKPVNIWGVNTGIYYGKKKHQLTFGYYWLSLNGYQRLIDFRKSAAKRVNLGYYTKTDLFYFSMMFWHNLINTKRFRVAIPLEVGIGATTNSANTFVNDIQLWKRNDVIIPIQLGLYGEWKATRWMGFISQFGYRASITQKHISEHYSSYYYSIGATFYTYQIYKDAIRLFKPKPQSVDN